MIATIERAATRSIDSEGLDREKPWAVGCGRPAPDQVTLTGREAEVLALLCHRLTNREIAEHLCISARTVESHVGRILTKFGAANRREAAASAMILNILPRLGADGRRPPGAKPQGWSADFRAFYGGAEPPHHP